MKQFVMSAIIASLAILCAVPSFAQGDKMIKGQGENPVYYA